jgi:hypothetical protein
VTTLKVSTAASFRAAIERRDIDALEPLFAEEARFYSPVKFRPFEGRAAIVTVLRAVLNAVEEFRYVGELHGAVEDAGAHVLIFRGTVAGRQIHGMDLLKLDAGGLITELTVMVRPQTAATALGDAVLAGLSS